MIIYIAGPMRGYLEWNFPAFDNAAANLRQLGHTPISPAAMDRVLGFDPMSPEEAVTTEFIGNALLRDLSIIHTECEAVALLSGWEMSNGAQTEVAFASALGKPVLYQRWSPSGRSMRWIPVTIRKGFLVESTEE